MKTYLLHLWDNARTSYWFVPTIFALGALLLASCLPLLDELVLNSGFDLPDWIRTTTVTARVTLSAMAGAMIAVTGTVFSITIVTLSLASQQFGPRLLRRFMSDITTQITLGVFLSTGFYCLLLLRVVEKSDDGLVAPHLSVLFAVILSIASMLMLIVFIHHISTLIQAPNVVSAVACDLDAAIVRLFPERIGSDASEQGAGDICTESKREDAAGKCIEISASQEGYIQAVAASSLLDWAKTNDAIVRLRSRPGDFITLDAHLADVWQVSDVVLEALNTKEIKKSLNEMVIVGRRRTPRQDVECAVEEIVEVAVRSLSPGINDPFTAMNCIDRLGASLGRLAQRQPASKYRYDDEGKLRVIARPVLFEEVLDSAFNQIRQYCKDSVAVTIRLLESLNSISQHVDSKVHRVAILHHAKMVARLAEDFAEESDRLAVHDRFEILMEGKKTRS